MKRLFVMRHAQAGWSSTSDFERPLTDKGEHDATAVGQILVRHASPPQHILASAAHRTRTTAERVAYELRLDASRIQTASKFYGASPLEWIEAIRRIDPSVPSLLVVGHNPAISGLAQQIARVDVGLRPADFVEIELPIDWEHVGRGTGTALDL